MAVRVTEEEVKAIIDTELTVEQVEPFIAAASIMVDEYLSSKITNSTVLKEVERWLAAHLIASGPDPREQEVRIGTIEVNLEGRTGQGLAFSRYGQQAMLLDTSGTLKNIGKQKAIFTVQGDSE